METINNNINLGINNNLHIENDTNITTIRKEKEFYNCYSPLQNEHLLKEGFMYLNDFINPVTKKKYWLYKITNALSRELVLWTNNNPKNKTI